MVILLIIIYRNEKYLFSSQYTWIDAKKLSKDLTLMSFERIFLHYQFNFDVRTTVHCHIKYSIFV